MKLRRLGRSGLEVSALALGTVELGMDYGIPVPGRYGRPPEEEAITLVHAALDGGINLVDTARAYGHSERVLGRALRGRRHEVVLATKVRTQADDGTSPRGEELRRSMLDSLETSLGYLQTDRVDIWQIHNLDQSLLEQVDLLGELFEEVRDRGMVRAVGASTYGSQMPLAALETGLFDVLQVTYSVLDQRLAERVFPLAVEQDVGIVVRSVLLQGVLTERGDYLPDHLAPLRERSRAFRALVARSETGLSPAQVAVAFGLHHPQIGAVLLGVRSQDELAEGLVAVEASLPPTLLEALHGLALDDERLLDPSTWRIAA